MEQTVLSQQELAYLAKRAAIGRDIIMQNSLEPNKRRDSPTFTATRAADLLGRSRQAVTRAIQELKLGKLTGDVTQTQYQLAQKDVMVLAEKFGVKPAEARPCAVVAVINQKGGVGKTTTSIHLSHYLALLGYRVALIDTDSQASATAYMGLNADVEVQEAETIFPILVGESDDLGKLLKKAPHFSNLDFVPSCLALSVANEMAFERQVREKYTGVQSDYVFFNRLAKAMEKIKPNYDVIVIDCPPHISPATYNAIYAADMALVPTSTSMLDVASTLRFISWLEDITPILIGLDIKRTKFLATSFEPSAVKSLAAEGSEEQSIERRRHFAAEGLDLLREIIGPNMMKTVTIRSSEVQRASSLLRSIYEIHRPLGSRDAWSRACESMDAVNREVVDVLEEVWSLKSARAQRAA